MASEGYKVVVAPDGKRYAVSNPARKSGCSGRLSNLLCFLFLAVLGLGGYFLYTQTDALDWLEDLLFGGEEDTSPIGPIGMYNEMGLIVHSPRTLKHRRGNTWKQWNRLHRHHFR